MVMLQVDTLQVDTLRVDTRWGRARDTPALESAVARLSVLDLLQEPWAAAS